ncbi:hypothetical protein L596_003736 [Steinernema carpocapsae]|uniref:Uncharacterized protein n=1 Tax=Steinernema carpocapsae TaxID=34508 RepID=A0A4U8UWU8_STECR|nr:hypothetical protein L596_003736 [Steinernema carpocapsae]
MRKWEKEACLRAGGQQQLFVCNSHFVKNVRTWQIHRQNNKEDRVKIATRKSVSAQFYDHMIGLERAPISTFFVILHKQTAALGTSTANKKQLIKGFPALAAVALAIDCKVN